MYLKSKYVHKGFHKSKILHTVESVLYNQVLLTSESSQVVIDPVCCYAEITFIIS